MECAEGQGPVMTERRGSKKPIFQKQHYNAIAELIGQKIVYGFIDEKDYSIIEAFAEMFAKDNPGTFDKDRFREAVYEAHTRKKDNNKEGNSDSLPDQ
jgi:hypothetical protein